jgi:hypothetical protein
MIQFGKEKGEKLLAWIGLSSMVGGILAGLFLNNLYFGALISILAFVIVGSAVPFSWIKSESEPHAPIFCAVPGHMKSKIMKEMK